MRTYGQYCPVARGAEIFAERWTPLIVRNLFLGCTTFTEILDGAPGLSRTLLTERLRTLERNGIVRTEPQPRGKGRLYFLTDAGVELADVCVALGTWGARWLEIAPPHMDPYVILWAACRSLDPTLLPKDRVVVRFDLRDFPRPLWMLAERGGAEVCVTHPGYDEDVVVTTDKPTLTAWHVGHTSLAAAQSEGALTIEGPPSLVRTFERWVPRSMFSDVAPVHS